jgi:hypothetical protein
MMAESMATVAVVDACSNTPAAFAEVTAAIHGTALNTATGISTVTTSNQSGNYNFTTLKIGGRYTVTDESPGFQKFESTGITLIVNANLGINAKMKIRPNSGKVPVLSGKKKPKARFQKWPSSSRLRNSRPITYSFSYSLNSHTKVGLTLSTLVSEKKAFLIRVS